MSTLRLFSRLKSAHSPFKRWILTEAFSLDKEWQSRHAHFQELLRSGDYEWISAVQKKFVGGGIASAVDVDAAVCIAEHKDQLSDVIELLYKLRHSPNAANVLPSSEYAAVRLLLKYQPATLIKLLNNPINYGIFLNDHSACLVIDYFLEKGEIQAAARASTFVMLQEQMDNQLLNLLALHACARWTELPLDEQTMQIEEEAPDEGKDDDREEEEKTLKFPYLKNPYFDDHFDIVNPANLVGKTMLWLGGKTEALDDEVAYSIDILANLLYDKHSVISKAEWSRVLPAVRQLITARLRKQLEAGPDERAEQMLKRIEEAEEKGDAAAREDKADKPEISLSQAIRLKIEQVKSVEEKKLMETQAAEFLAWIARRRQLVEVQAEKLQLKLKMEEITKELKEIDEEKERIFFFENRLSWEKSAERNVEIQKDWQELVAKSKAKAN